MLEIRKVLGLSLTHITEETCCRLDRDPEDNNIGLTIYPFYYGYFVFVGNLGIIGDDVAYKDGGEDVCEDNICKNLPKDLKDCIILAIKNDCQWIQFDSDAGETELLHVYEDDE